MLVAASFKQEMENLVPVRIMCASATSPGVRSVFSSRAWVWMQSRRHSEHPQASLSPGDVGPAAAGQGDAPGAPAGARDGAADRGQAGSREDLTHVVLS